ncbi:hypothetical protein P154DRAFT_537830 [Amniculicola lignicola CBS 123094]|uniref:Uncharacterized protein n=1 Tax=Amniculicola lignicola CBS 123094 TaxID=1392246 RepID=A0A6A5W6A8_9PLEO|nr:hypothetical protein P154DRAFT_537830 [Amniculicola lignicola CBS 123094]
MRQPSLYYLPKNPYTTPNPGYARTPARRFPQLAQATRAHHPADAIEYAARDHEKAKREYEDAKAEYEAVKAKQEDAKKKHDNAKKKLEDTEEVLMQAKCYGGPSW